MEKQRKLPLLEGENEEQYLESKSEGIMSLPFTLPNTTLIQNPPDLLVYLNVSTGYLLGPITLTCVFIITFMGLKAYNASKAYASACWLTALISLPLAVVGLVAFEITTVLLVMAFTSVIFIRENVEYD